MTPCPHCATSVDEELLANTPVGKRCPLCAGTHWTTQLDEEEALSRVFVDDYSWGTRNRLIIKIREYFSGMIYANR